MLYSGPANADNLSHCLSTIDAARLKSGGSVFGKVVLDGCTVYTTEPVDLSDLSVETDLQNDKSDELIDFLYGKSIPHGVLAVIEPWLDRTEALREPLPNEIERYWVGELAIDVINTGQLSGPEVGNHLRRDLLDSIIYVPSKSPFNPDKYDWSMGDIYILSYQGGGLLHLNNRGDHL